ncbi:COG1559 Aminodeoxychorismate lyase [Candidatus Nanopelagicaceae bacterium]
MKIWNSSPFFRIVIALVLVGVVTLSLHFVRVPGSSAPDFPCGSPSQTRANINIASGESGSEIAQSLFLAGVVKSSESYFRVAVGDPRSQKVAPGNHEIDLNLCATEALNQLLDSSRITGLINIAEGAWLSEILPQFYAANFSKSDVSSALSTAVKPSGFSSIEGLLFPAQYSFATDTSARVALQSMIDRASKEMTAAGFFSSRGKFTPQQLLIIASLVQAEGNTEDFARISQVIRNRIAKGMPLQFDSTVHYVKKSRGSIFLSTQSTLLNSPYNTYRKYGLPPGPINNPGSDALRAAVNPTPGDWLYFITVAPFDTRYTSDINQFNDWKVEYKKNLRAGKFRSKK